MFGPAFFFVGALTFICLGSSSALTAKQAKSVCALLPEGENIANPADCSQYYTCSKGKAYLNSCLGSNLFSKESQGCVPPDQSPCGSEDSDPCAYMSDGYFVSVTNSCSDYYYCEGGKGLKSSCGKGLNFDQASQSCKYQSELPCQESTPGDESLNICEVVQSDIYFGVSTSCKGWQKCRSNAPAEVGTCEDPYVFNVDTQACDYKENTNCRQLQGGSGTGGTSLQGTPCEKNGEVISDTTCTGYYICTNKKYVFGKCMNGLYFNPGTNRCVSRLDALNDCDRCQDSKLQFVNLYQDDCTGYGVCQNGKMTSTGECPGGYFSELAGSCIQNGNNPEFPVCYVPEEPEPTEPSVTSTTVDTTISTESSSSTSTTTTPKPKKTTTTEEPSKETDKPEETEESQEKKKSNETEKSEESDQSEESGKTEEDDY